MRRLLRVVLTVLLSSTAALAQPSLSATGIFPRVSASDAKCGTDFCSATTKYPPNSLAQALALPAFNVQDDAYTTAARGWLFTMRPSSPGWQLYLEPLTGLVSRVDQLAYPEPRQRPVPAAKTPVLKPPAKPTFCTVAVDVRGLGNLERAQSAFVFDSAGHQLWPDAALVKAVSSQQVNEGSLQTYIWSEGPLKRIPKLTRVKAVRIQPTRFAPASNYLTDAVLGPTAAAQFRAAGSACHLIFLKN